MTSEPTNQSGGANGSAGCVPGLGLEAWILPPILTIDVVLGLLGNAVAMWIFFCRVKGWNPNILFLFNLVMADFMVLVSLPLRVHALLEGYWLFGDAMCRINLFLMFSNRSASIAFMTIVAVDRYFKVVHPHHRVNRMSMAQAGAVALLAWLLVMAPRFPLLLHNHLKQVHSSTQCFFFSSSYKETSPVILKLVVMHRILYVLEFLFPLAILIFCSARITVILRQRNMDKLKNVRRAMRTLGVIIGVFIICFLPGTLTTIGLWVVVRFRPWDCASFITLIQLTIVSFGFNFLNSALDPIIYCFSSTRFRAALKSAFCSAGRCGVEPSSGEEVEIELSPSGSSSK